MYVLINIIRMNSFEIFLVVMVSFIAFPIVGMLGYIFIMMLARLADYLEGNYEKWSEEYGETKTLYVISYLIGALIFVFLFYIIDKI